jgi:hypothetical protein
MYTPDDIDIMQWNIEGNCSHCGGKPNPSFDPEGYRSMKQKRYLDTMHDKWIHCRTCVYYMLYMYYPCHLNIEENSIRFIAGGERTDPYYISTPLAKYTYENVKFVSIADLKEKYFVHTDVTKQFTSTVHDTTS